jgi:hypothetical protein
MGVAMSQLSLSRFQYVLLAAIGCALIALPALADSQARIVRLSDVQGNVQIDKNTGLGFENAFLNLPITQGAELKTSANGRAEIEFEDGSTMRLAPNSTVLFSTLGLTDAGKHTSVVNLVEGMAYVNWLGKSGDEFTLNFSRETTVLDRYAHIRVDVSAEAANLAVFKGNVSVDSPSGKVALEKNKTAKFDVANDDKSTVADKIVPAPLDQWDEQAIAYHDQYAKNNSPSPYGYGSSDLNYYGNYTNVPGYGMMWQPFFTGVGWDPFMDGAWSWYPGFGYMYTSPYPWGWMPYHYGNWMFIPGLGWMWQPGGYNNNWVPIPHFTASSAVHVNTLVAPTGTVKTVVVGKGGPVLTTSSPRLVAGSAGLGIARGSLNNLHHLNAEVAKNGFAVVHPSAQFASSAGHATFGGGSPSSSGMSMGHASSGGGHASGGGGSHR